MFERFDINDLYLAHVVVAFPRNTGGYGYLTILKKSGKNYIDLQNMNRIVTETSNPNEISYVIYRKEPLSNHYTQSGNKKVAFTRKTAISVGSQYYGTLCEYKALSKSK